MILQSPEPSAPEPYLSYIRQRGEAIAAQLASVVGEIDAQLCPRAISVVERHFPADSSIVYGAVVRHPSDGYKSVLYAPPFAGRGIVAKSLEQAATYTQSELARGNRVRLKDPTQSDSQGQLTIESLEELSAAMEQLTQGHELGCILMPHLAQIRQRVSVGRLALGKVGAYEYIGLETTTSNNGREVYGGTMLGLFRRGQAEHRRRVEQHFGLPPNVAQLGFAALNTYKKVAIYDGRVSVDVIDGVTDSGECFQGVVDITPRVSGATPAEVLALGQVYQQDLLCLAYSRLDYNPDRPPITGTQFVSTDSLVITAVVQEVAA